MPNAWVEFVRQYAKENNLSYGCAISEAGPAYRKMKAMNAKPKEGKKGKVIVQKKPKEEETFEELRQKIMAHLIYTKPNDIKSSLMNLNDKVKLSKFDKNKLSINDYEHIYGLIFNKYNTIPLMKSLILELDAKNKNIDIYNNPSVRLFDDYLPENQEEVRSRWGSLPGYIDLKD